MDARKTGTRTKEAARPPEVARGIGLAGRMLALTLGFAMLAQLVIYPVAIAGFRDNWLGDRLASAHTAAMLFEEAPKEAMNQALAMSLLDSVGAKSIAIRIGGADKMLALKEAPGPVAETYDLRAPGFFASIASALRAMVAAPATDIAVKGAAPMGGEFVEVTLDETPLVGAMRAYSWRLLLNSLAVSAIVALLAAGAINWLILRPVRRLTRSLIAFGADPQDRSRVIAPSGARGEVGLAEAALARMQARLARELAQQKRLAALGLAVAKVNHDLRNMLTPAQLFSDRLASISDPLARRLVPKLVAALDRAIAFCEATLTYGAARETAPRPAPVDLHMVAGDALEAAGARAPGVVLRNEVAPGSRVTADPDHLFRILLNLARNAVEAAKRQDGSEVGSEDGREGGLVRVSAMRREDGAVEIAVCDDGPGVPEAFKATLFEAFQSGARQGGTGLGLSIAAELAHAMGGSLRLDPPLPGDQCQGARFTLTLPGV